MLHGRYERAIEIFNRFIIEPYPFHIVGRYCRGINYLKQNKDSIAIEDFKKCVEWIGKNEESLRLFNLYRDRMPKLKQYLN